MRGIGCLETAVEVAGVPGRPAAGGQFGVHERRQTRQILAGPPGGNVDRRCLVILFVRSLGLGALLHGLDGTELSPRPRRSAEGEGTGFLLRGRCSV
jgi:hypothetical protein